MIMKVLHKNNGNPYSIQYIKKCVSKFGEGYKKTVKEVIRNSANGVNKRVFFENVSKLMANFKMTRSGPFKRVRYSDGNVNDPDEIVASCWNIANQNIIQIRKFIDEKTKGKRGRTLIELSNSDRKFVILELWLVFKKLLPFCMSKTSWGLVGASKVLFAVLPEIALPIDNVMWKKVFKTIDYSDIISGMVVEIADWERQRGANLDSCDPFLESTLPSVYNVMAMKARPNM